MAGSPPPERHRVPRPPTVPGTSAPRGPRRAIVCFRGEGKSMPSDELIPVLYLAPWVDVGGSDKATVDWFRFLDRDRFRASLITTQPSPNRRLREVAPYAEELWELPELMAGDEFPDFILSFIVTRGIRLVH